MIIHEKILEALKTFDYYVTVRELAEKFKEMYPDDFKRIDEKAKNREIKSKGFAELTHRIRKNLRENEKWSGLITNYNNSLPIKVKYVGNLGIKDVKEFMDNLYYPINEKKDIGSAPFEVVVDQLGYFDFEFIDKDNKLPRRDDPIYIGDKDSKGIEQIQQYEYSACVMLLMAHRNPEVLDVISKIEYIQDLMRNPIIKQRKESYNFIKQSMTKTHNVSEGTTGKILKEWEENLDNNIKILLSKSEEECSEYKQELEKNILNNELIQPNYEEAIRLQILNYFSNKNVISPHNLQDEYRYILKLPFNKFNKELEFFDDSDKVKDFFNKNKMFDKTSQYLYKLSVIMELLQDKLKLEFNIYPHKYYKEMKEACSHKVKNKDISRSTSGSIAAMKILNDSVIQNALERFTYLKHYITDPNNKKKKIFTMKDVTDMFYMYDYYISRSDKNRTDITLNVIAKELKYAMTQYYGVTIKKSNKLIQYCDCEERFDEFKEEAKFYFTERTITDKINIMIGLIEKKDFRYLIFH